MNIQAEQHGSEADRKIANLQREVDRMQGLFYVIFCSMASMFLHLRI